MMPVAVDLPGLSLPTALMPARTSEELGEANMSPCTAPVAIPGPTYPERCRNNNNAIWTAYCNIE